MRFIATVLALLLGPMTALAGDDWPHFGGGQHGRQYSPLTQISADNVAKLEEAWRFRTGELGEGYRQPFAFQATPMTYFLEETGRQYVVIVAGGHPNMGTMLGDYVVAFALPDREPAAR